MEIENIILSKATQTQKDKHGILYLQMDINCKIRDNHPSQTQKG